MRATALAFAICPSLLLAGDTSASNAYVPLTPKGVMVHSAYMELTNSGTETRSLIAFKAPGYAMAHLHQSVEKDGIATMSAMHQLDIQPGQTVSLKPGGMHVMLMKPKASVRLGETVELALEFANGEKLFVMASVVRLNASS